ncbi:RING finger protein nhl-1 [Toxocara canis]|uniref:RING finger protein nhl-1 n=1 Tax=Toxocara canis TaxID=6265 RepID=A0A0B2V9M4_TOXCA|nr:RING finger protein nhl-1 [Toxocara canis]
MASSSAQVSRDRASPQNNVASLDHIRQMLLTPPASRPPEFENPLEKIEQLLTCPICLDRYKQPKLLPCHHTFCLPCLDNCADVVHRTLKCPECRAEHPLPYDGVKSFQTNYTLTGFLDIHLQATDDNAAQLEAYIQRYNLERCKICDEKANLEVCAHCERRACADCRSTHMEMLKRDLNRMLNQVKRLSSRITEASDGLSKGAELLTLNCETTKDEVKEYFRRYYRELKKKEEMFIQEIETFHSTETRLMRNLRDVLEIESSNMSEGCAYLEAALKGEREVEDAELAKFKSIFSEGLEYLRNFQPDAEELFSKKLRFSPGDDASKLPTAIANFGELTVSLPQFAGRYLPLEQSYLPRPIRIGYESDNYKYSTRRNETDDGRTQNSRYSSRNDDDIMSIRYRRRQQMEEEAWNRLRANADVGQLSPAHNHTPGNSPWSRAVVTSGPMTPVENSNTVDTTNNLTAAAAKVAEYLQPPTQNSHIRSADSPNTAGATATPPAQSSSTNSQQPTTAAATKMAIPHEVVNEAETTTEAPRSILARNSPSTVPGTAGPLAQPSAAPTAAVQPTRINSQIAAAATTPANALAGVEAAMVKSNVETGRTATRRVPPIRQTSSDDASLNEKVENIRVAHEKRRQRNKTIAEASIERRTNTSTTTTQSSEESESDTDAAPVLSHSTDSTTQRFVPPPPPRQESIDTSYNTDTDTAAQQTSTSTTIPYAVPDRRARFRRRASAMAAEREASNEARLNKMLPSKFLCTVDYQSKSKPRLVFGKKGSKEGDLNWPRGVTAICGNEFAVCDSSNHRICVFNTQGRLLRTFGRYGTGEGQLDSAAGICSNRFRQLIVSDRYNHRIVIFDQLGQFIRAFGGHGPSNGRFNNPWGVCVDEAGMIYAVDKDNHRVQVFDPKGQFMSKFGSMGPGPGQLHNPQFIAYAKHTQHLYVTDSSNHRVCVFDHNGNPVFQFGQEGFHNGQLKFPRGIAVDDQGFIIVADSGNNRVQIFYPDGRFMHSFGTWGTGAGQLKGLEDVALIENTIIVSDRENHRIQLF